MVPVLEVASGRFLRKFKGHTDQTLSVAFSPDGAILATGGMDTTILLWDMKRLVRPDAAAKKPVAEHLRFYWDKLADLDGVAAYDAILALADISGESVPFLAEQVKPVESPSQEQLAKLIADFDDDSFEVREAASAKLTALHELARPREALDGKKSAEVAVASVRSWTASIRRSIRPP